MKDRKIQPVASALQHVGIFLSQHFSVRFFAADSRVVTIKAFANLCAFAALRERFSAGSKKSHAKTLRRKGYAKGFKANSLKRGGTVNE